MKKTFNHIQVDVIKEHHNKKNIPLSTESILKFIKENGAEIRSIIDSWERDPKKITNILNNKENNDNR